jgi:hypothetical protein
MTRMRTMIEASLVASGLLAEGVPPNWGQVTSGMNVAWRSSQDARGVANARQAAGAKAAALQQAAGRVAELVQGLDRPATDPRMQAAVIALNKAVDGLLFQVGFAHGAAHPDTEE